MSPQRPSSPLRLSAGLALSLVLALAAGAGEDAKDDALQGTWGIAAAEVDGKPLPEETRRSIKLVVEGGKYTVTAGETADRGTVKLNPAARPKDVDITGTDGPNKGETIRGIYERDGDTLRVCYDLSGRGRPEEFKAPEGSQFLYGIALNFRVTCLAPLSPSTGRGENKNGQGDSVLLVTYKRQKP